MLDNLFKSFDGLLKEKHSLSAKAHQLARNERQLVEKLSRALAGSGYRVVPVSDAGSAPGRAEGKTRGAHQAAAVPEMRANLRSPAADVPASEGHAQCHGGRQEEGPEEVRVTPARAPAVLDLGSARG